MASYVPWYGKKRVRLAKLERQFIELLKNRTDPTTLSEAAEIVRAAKIRSLKSRRAQFPPSESSYAAIATLEQEIQRCNAATASEIIATYRKDDCTDRLAQRRN